MGGSLPSICEGFLSRRGSALLHRRPARGGEPAAASEPSACWEREGQALLIRLWGLPQPHVTVTLNVSQRQPSQQPPGCDRG